MFLAFFVTIFLPGLMEWRGDVTGVLSSMCGGPRVYSARNNFNFPGLCHKFLKRWLSEACLTNLRGPRHLLLFLYKFPSNEPFHRSPSLPFHFSSSIAMGFSTFDCIIFGESISHVYSHQTSFHFIILG